MPFDIPYGNSITADRAADVVKAIVAEATKSPVLEARHFRRRYARRTRRFLQDGQHAARVGADLAKQGPNGGAPAASDADLQHRDANSCRRLHRHARLTSADRIARRHPACRGRQDHRRGRLQRRHGRPGCGGLQGRRRQGEVTAPARFLRHSPVRNCAPEGARSAILDVQLHIRESIEPHLSREMDSGAAAGCPGMTATCWAKVDRRHASISTGVRVNAILRWRIQLIV